MPRSGKMNLAVGFNPQIIDNGCSRRVATIEMTGYFIRR